MACVEALPGLSCRLKSDERRPQKQKEEPSVKSRKKQGDLDKYSETFTFATAPLAEEQRGCS